MTTAMIVENQIDLRDYIEKMEFVRQLVYSTLDFERLMSRLMLVAADVINCETASIVLLEQDEWVVRYAYGHNKGFPKEILGMTIKDSEMPHALLAMRMKKHVIINDAFTDDRVNQEFMKQWGLRSVIVIPMISKKEVIGAIFFNYYNGVQQFNELSIEFIKSLSATISTAIQNIKLYERSCYEFEQRDKIAKKYEALFHSIDEAFFIQEVVFNPKGEAIDFHIIETNSVATEIFGLEKIAEKLSRTVFGDDGIAIIEEYGKVALTGEPNRFNFEMKSCDRWFSVYAFRVDSGSIGQVGALFREITDEVKAKSEMEKSLKAQDEVFSNIAHELKTPLNVIFSTVQLLEFYSGAGIIDNYNERVTASMKTIKQNCYRLTKLINNVVDLSKIDSGFYSLNLKNQNLVRVVEDIVQSISDYIHERSLNLIFDTNVEEKILACDADKIERVVLNLISNAIKFSDAKGTIYVNFEDKGSSVELSVQDTGVGIDRKYWESIFGKFQQVNKTLSRNAEGTGIGLSLVKSLVNMHDGNIRVESKVNEGSKFIIELPVKMVDCSLMDKLGVQFNNKIDLINVEFSDIYNL